MKEDVLILTVGLPYSGKSTWALSACHPIVCPDKIRLALHGQRFEPLAEPMVWAIAKVMVRSLFGAGHETVILDGCSHTANRRDDWHFPEEWKRKYLVCDVHADVVIQRARENNDDYIIPIIERMAEAIEYDGILYGIGDLEGDKRFMENHIKCPGSGALIEEMQLYHEGIAGDDI